jgi:hypothetical protein
MNIPVKNLIIFLRWLQRAESDWIKSGATCEKYQALTFGKCKKSRGSRPEQPPQYETFDQ